MNGTNGRCTAPEVVHRIAKDRYIVKLATDPDVPAPRRKSPKDGSVLQVFSALACIPALLAHPNLTLEVVIAIESPVFGPSAAPPP